MMAHRLWMILALLMVGGIVACSPASSEPVDLPTRVVIATLPPLEDIPSPVSDATQTPAPIAPPDGDTITATPEEIALEPTLTPEMTDEADQPVVIPSNTITNTPTREPTATPTETVEPLAVSFLAELALELTIVLPTDRPHVTNTPIVIYQQSADNPWAVQPVQTNQPNQPAPTCQSLPAGVFASVIVANPAITGTVGCPMGEPPTTTSYSGALQTFQHGAMLWLGTTPSSIYVLYDDGRMERYADTFVQGVDPDHLGEEPPQGLTAPIRGFGKIWASNPTVRSSLGWAIQGEQGIDTLVHEFTNGRMVHSLTHNLIYIFATTSNTWQRVTP